LVDAGITSLPGIFRIPRPRLCPNIVGTIVLDFHL
jgi:hypothetical protein